MKHKYVLIALIIALIVPATSNAQRRKVRQKPKTTVVEEPEEDPRITQMLAATQQIVFIDSMVVDKADFMRYIPLSADCGRIEQTDSMLGNHTTEIGDLRIMSIAQNDSVNHLFTTEQFAGEWTQPLSLDGIGEASATFPYLMPDGTTLYFAQQGEKSIGGYDIFVTRYNVETHAFLKPENIGMPFASEANDYFYAIDEFMQLGYFVTDRRQPVGKVCIYVFIPNDTRRLYQSEAYSDEQIRSLARIDRIADTWNAARNEALQRLSEARSQQAAPTREPITPTTELDNMRHQAKVLQKALLLARNYYAHASESDRASLYAEIVKSEKELETLKLEIRKKERESNQ